MSPVTGAVTAGQAAASASAASACAASASGIPAALRERDPHGPDLRRRTGPPCWPARQPLLPASLPYLSPWGSPAFAGVTAADAATVLSATTLRHLNKVFALTRRKYQHPA